MANIKTRLGMLVMVLALGIAVIGCDNGNGVEGRPPYSVRIEISAPSTNAYVNAYVYDSSGDFIRTASIKIDGVSIVVQSSNYYFASLGTIWGEGSTHVYNITTPDGVNETGTIVKPVGALTGVIYNPSQTLSTSYTVSPPSGQWPSGSYLNCIVFNNGYYGFPRFPSGANDEIFSGSRFEGATSVSFYSALMNEIRLSKFTSNSYVRIIGNRTPW
jgi:hypothetical protein